MTNNNDQLQGLQMAIITWLQGYNNYNNNNRFLMGEISYDKEQQENLEESQKNSKKT
jgi:hypothetical protein